MDHKEVLSALVKGVNGGGTVTVRETNFGYVIRSEQVSPKGSLRGRIAPYVLAAFGLAAIGVWFIPFGGFGVAMKVFVSGVMLCLGCLAFAIIRSVTSGFELHVDTRRRELRAAVLTAKGDSWIRSSARFRDITDVYLRRSKPGHELRSLCMRVDGEQEAMPVAIGSEKTLLGLHNRLMKDLRPLEEQLAGFKTVAKLAKRSLHEVFPQIGPNELPS